MSATQTSISHDLILRQLLQSPSGQSVIMCQVPQLLAGREPCAPACSHLPLGHELVHPCHEACRCFLPPHIFDNIAPEAFVRIGLCLLPLTQKACDPRLKSPCPPTNGCPTGPPSLAQIRPFMGMRVTCACPLQLSRYLPC